jgi:hypothetical protein
MVCIKFTARLRTPIVLPKFCSMASNKASEVSTERRGTLTEQLEESLAGQQMVASMEAVLSREAESDHENQSDDFGDS